MAREVVNKMDMTKNERLLEKLGCKMDITKNERLLERLRCLTEFRITEQKGSINGVMRYSTKGAIGTFAEKLSTTQEGYEIYRVRYAYCHVGHNPIENRDWLFLAYDPVSGVEASGPGVADDLVKRLQTKIKKTVKAKLLGAA